MNSKPLLRRELVARDVEGIIDHYLDEGAPQAADRFVTELEKALAHIGLHPGTGSLRYAAPLRMPGLRFWRLTGFPYLVFFVELKEHVDVLRVLHERRDLPAWLGVDE